MMNNLEKQHLIKKEKLNQSHYFQSLLQEAHQLNLFTHSEFENIQLQTLELLAMQTERYTGGESSSIKIETAQDILLSVFYTVGIYLKSFPDADMSVAALKQKTLSELYRQGKKLIEVQSESARQLLDTIQKNNIVTDNYAYNDTIQNGLPVFFSAYDIDFAAHDTPASIDYPLSSDKMELTGIEYIYNYLQKLFWENQFCKNFSDHDIHCLLLGYDDHYQDLLVNIFGVVLINVTGCILANKNIVQLNIEPSDRQYLQQKLANLSTDSLDKMLQETAEQLCKEFNITDRFLQRYIITTVTGLSPRLKNALENNRLDKLFVSLKENHPQPVVHFQDGKKMDDELFRKIVDEIRQCRYISDKIDIIKREIHSITDLVDILEGYCIFDDEFSEIFQSLEDMELALLLKKLPADKTHSDLHFTENEKEWHNRLNGFFTEIDLTRREDIRNLSAKINLG